MSENKMTGPELDALLRKRYQLIQDGKIEEAKKIDELPELKNWLESNLIELDDDPEDTE